MGSASQLTLRLMQRNRLPPHTQDLFQTESDPGEWKPTLALSEPRYSFWFWLFQILSFILAISIGLLRLKKSSSSNHLLKQKEKLLALKIREALKHKDVAGFYRNLSKSIKLRVGIACHYSNTQHYRVLRLFICYKILLSLKRLSKKLFNY